MLSLEAKRKLQQETPDFTPEEVAAIRESFRQEEEERQAKEKIRQEHRADPQWSYLKLKAKEERESDQRRKEFLKEAGLAEEDPPKNVPIKNIETP